MDSVEERQLGNTIIIMLSVFAFVINVILGGGNRFWIFLTGGGYLFDFGKAQYELVFNKLQLWRLVSSGYLHIGILHLGANISALWCLGNIVEKKIGTIKYLLLYHLVMIISVAIQCMIFKENTTVGASSGIFAVIGYFLVWVGISKKILEQLSIRKRNYILGYSIVGNLILPSTTVIHAVSFILGVICGLMENVSSQDQVKQI